MLNFLTKHRTCKFTLKTIVVSLMIAVILLNSVIYVQARVERVILSPYLCLYYNVRRAVDAQREGHDVKIYGGAVAYKDENNIVRTGPHVWYEVDGKLSDYTVPPEYVVEYKPDYSFKLGADFTLRNYLVALELKRSVLNPRVFFNLLPTFFMTKGTYDASSAKSKEIVYANKNT